MLRTTPAMRRTPVLLVLVLLAGCNASLYERKVTAAKQARARGDLATEALFWKQACQMKPAQRDTCAEADHTAGTLIQSSLATHGPTCQRGDLSACASGLAGLRKVRPDHPQAMALLREAEALHQKTCATLDRKGNPSMILARFGCVAGVGPLVADPAYEAVVEEERAHAARGLLEHGRAAPPAASYVYHRSAQCFSSSVTNGVAVQAAADAFLREAALPVIVRTRGTGASLLASSMNACPYVVDELGPRATCARGVPGPPPDLTMDLTVGLGAVEHRIASEVRVASYVSGIETYANPSRPSAESTVARAQGAFEAIEQETLDREAQCNRLRTRGACDSYNAIVPTYNQRKQNLNQAQNELANTPPTLTRELVERVSYTVHHHTWSVPYSVSARSQAGAEASREGVFERRDSEHVGVRPANLAPDPLLVPRIEDFNAELVKVARAVGKSVLAVGFKQRATCAEPTWDLDDVARLDCRARSELYLKGELPKPEAWRVDCR